MRYGKFLFLQFPFFGQVLAHMEDLCIAPRPIS